MPSATPTTSVKEPCSGFHPSSPMFAKLLLIILVMSATACALLVNRQQRIDTAHQLAQLHQEILRQRQQCWAIRRDIAFESQPERIRAALAEIGGQWTPIVITEPAPL